MISVTIVKPVWQCGFNLRTFKIAILSLPTYNPFDPYEALWEITTIQKQCVSWFPGSSFWFSFSFASIHQFLKWQFYHSQDLSTLIPIKLYAKYHFPKRYCRSFSGNISWISPVLLLYCFLTFQVAIVSLPVYTIFNAHRSLPENFLWITLASTFICYHLK